MIRLGATKEPAPEKQEVKKPAAKKAVKSNNDAKRNKTK